MNNLIKESYNLKKNLFNLYRFYKENHIKYDNTMTKKQLCIRNLI